MRVYASHITSRAEAVARTRLPQCAERGVVENDDDRAGGEGIGAEIKEPGIQNEVQALLGGEGDDQVVGVIVGVVFVEPENLAAIRRAGDIGVAGAEGLSIGGCTDDHATGGNGGAVCLPAEARPLIASVYIERGATFQTVNYVKETLQNGHFRETAKRRQILQSIAAENLTVLHHVESEPRFAF